MTSEINNNQLQMTELIKRKCEIEARISELGEILKAEGDVGMTGNLIDNEGYPHAHIDIYKIRLTRQEINCLQNDYKDLLKEIDERGIPFTSEISQLLTKYESEAPRTFLKITQVDADSPSELAGLEKNDEIVQFGPFTAYNHSASSLTEISGHVKEREGKIILLKVLRKVTGQSDQILRLKLVPQKWSGHGLLGCKLITI